MTKPLQGTHRSLSPRTHSFHTIYDAAGRLYSTSYESASWGEPYIFDQEFFTYDGDGLLVKIHTSHQVDEDPPETETTYKVRSSVLGGEVVYDAGITYIRANGTVVATQSGQNTVWMHKDLQMDSLRSTDVNGNIVSSPVFSDWDKHELDPTGKSVGFTDPYYIVGVPEPYSEYFGPFESFGGLVNGQFTSYTVDGISVPQGYFIRMTEFAYGGIFGLVEHQARLSAQFAGYSVNFRDGNRTYPRNFGGDLDAASSFAVRMNQNTVWRNWAVTDSSWALNLSLIPFQSQRQPQQQIPVPGIAKPEIAKFDEQKFKKCVKDLFHTDVDSYEIGKKFNGRSRDSVDWFTDIFIEPFAGLFGVDVSAFEINTKSIHSRELAYKVGGILGSGGHVVFGWTYASDPQNNFIVSDIGNREFQQAIWVYELGNALGYITGNKPTVQDPGRYESASVNNPDDVGGALTDCVFGGAVDPNGRVKPPVSRTIILQ